MSHKSSNRKEQAKKTREKIYKTATKLIETKGFDNVTVAEICKKADVSVGSFYNYFESKHDILNEIFKLADNYFYEEVKNNVRGSSLEKINQYMITYAEYNVKNGVDFTTQLYASKNNLFAIKRRPMQLGLDEIIKEGQKNKEIRNDIDSYKIVDYIYICIRGVIHDWCLSKGKYDLVNRVEIYLNYMLEAIKI